MAAYGSGAVARSIRDECTVMNVDVGGGTSKIAVCADGKVTDLAALDVGARLVCLDAATARSCASRRPAGATARSSASSSRPAACSRSTRPRARQPDGRQAVRGDARRRADARRARACCAPIRSPIAARSTQIQFSGGVVGVHLRQREQASSAISARCSPAEIRARVEAFCPRLEPSIEGIRATVVGASQYTIQLSGSTIYVAPLDARAAAQRAGDRAGAAARRRRRSTPRRSRARSQAMLKRLDLADGEQPVALFVPWQGSATFQRLDAFCRGVVDGLTGVLSNGHPLVLAGDGDVGGLLGIHLHEEMKLANAGRVDRRARAEGVRLHRHRRDAGKLGRRAGGDQVADLSGRDSARNRETKASASAAVRPREAS